MKKITFLKMLLIMVISQSLYAQSSIQREIDSLEKEINTNKDSSKVKILNTLSYKFSNINTDSGIYYSQLALNLSKLIKWKKGIAWAYNDIGVNYDRKNNNFNALNNYYISLKLAEEINEFRLIGQLNLNIGIIYTNEGDLKKGFECYTKALYLNKKYSNNDNYLLNLNALGDYYSKLKLYDNANFYYNSALKISIQTGNIQSQSDIYVYLGDNYLQQKKYLNALNNYFNAKKIYLEIGDEQSLPNVLGAVGITYLSMVTDLSLDIKHDSLIGITKEENLKKALYYLNLSYQLGKKNNNLSNVLEVIQSLANAYSLKNNYDSAFYFLKIYTTIHDSLNAPENYIKINNLETQREKELQDKIKQFEDTKRLYFYIGLTAGIVVLLLIIFLILRNNQLLGKEKNRSEALLHNILPVAIANELREFGHTKAQYYEEVTVFFSDFVGFTKTAMRLTPQELVSELDFCFKGFDEIIGKYNIEKIKTVGDAYMAVSGMPKSNSNHATELTQAAIEIRDFMAARRTTLGEMTFEVRLGLHTGPVVAGVVGIRKFAYDIWGDTVNTASRMESNSETGKINISETTYQKVKEQFSCTFRGEIEAKNKGLLKMYFVESLYI